MNLSGDSAGARHGDESLFAQSARVCPACGSVAHREDARFCAACGQRLGGEYFPTDALRASYRFERVPSAAIQTSMSRASSKKGIALSRQRRACVRLRSESMHARSLSGVTATARAFVTYALVPYIGIVFCPGALLIGFVGYIRASRTPHGTGRREAVVTVVLGIVVLCAQVALWWFLYKVPEWSRQSPF